jgi:hypothetical protein
MSKGWKDIELLAALTSNNSPKFNQLIDRLREEARGLSEILGNGEEDAVSQAIDKAVDWLRSDEPFKVNHPMPYVKRLIHNSIIDYGRTRKEQAVSDDEIQEELAWIGEEVGDLDEVETTGWHGTKSNEKQVVLATEYPEHLWLRILDNLRLYEGWQTQPIMSAYLFDKFRGKGIRITDSLERKVLKSQQDERWRQYKLTMAYINSISSLREQEILKHYLWRYSVTDLAQKLNATKPYISKVVTKWMRLWGWDKPKRDKIRIILLTYHLGIIYRKWETSLGSRVADYSKQWKEDCNKREIEDARRIIEKMKQLSSISAEQQELMEIMTRIVEPGERENAENRLTTIDSEEFRKIIGALSIEVKKTPQTSCYFSDLKDIDNLGLREICSRCYYYWYGKIEI